MQFWLILMLLLNIMLNQQGYLGQEIPTRIPVRFMPRVVRPDHSVPMFSPDGREIYWAQRWEGSPYRQILSMRFQDGRWSSPEIAAFSKDNDADCPIISPDGQTLFFNSTRPVSEDIDGRRERYWFVARTSSGWSDPLPVSSSINRDHLHWQASVDRHGNLYFGSERKGSIGKDDIFMAPKTEHGYGEPQSLPSPINTKSHESTPFIGPNGDYLLFSRVDFSSVQQPYPLGLLVSYRRKDGTWDEPVPVPLAGVPKEVVCPFVTRDDRFLLFLVVNENEKAVYWVDASVVWELKREQ
jgi:hypothetical protein